MKANYRSARRSRLALPWCLLFLAALAPATGAQEFDGYGRWVNGVSEAWHFDDNITKADVAAAQSRWVSIGADTQNAKDNAWVGTYFVGGDTHGTYMRWSPRGGYVIMSVDKCAASVMTLDYGRVTVSPPVVEFHSEVDRSSARPHQQGHGHRQMPVERRFVPVKWRGELLLVSEDEIADFGDSVAGLGEFNGLVATSFGVSFFLSKLGAEDAATDPADDVPTVAPGYEQFIKKPISATVTAVGRRRLTRGYTHEAKSKYFSFSMPHEKASLISVTVNVGAIHGAKPGMFLRITTPDHGEFVTLSRVGKSSSTGVIVRDLDDEGKEFFYDRDAGRESVYPKVAVGWKLTTALPE